MNELKPMTASEQENPNLKSYTIFKIYVLAALMVTFLSIILVMMDAYGVGSIFGFSGSLLLQKWPIFLCGLVLLLIFLLPEQRFRSQTVNMTHKIMTAFKKLGFLNWLFVIVLVCFYTYFAIIGKPLILQTLQLKILVFGYLSLFSAILLNGTGKIKPIAALISGFSLYGLLVWALYWISTVHSYPLAVGWSETTWFYDASLFFPKRIYGFRVPLSSLHPSRYLLESAAFLIPNLGLWGHRLWQALLWIGLTLAGGIALQKRVKPTNPWLGLGLVAWFALFTFQGPVYFHLMLVIIIVLLGFDINRLGRSFFFMVVASLWAGFSRVNWFPVAGMLAATLYILEMPQKGVTFWKYWRWPVMSALLGLPVAICAFAIFILISGRPFGDFVTSFQSPLLIYRLFPSEAYGNGILLMLLYISLPALVLITWYLIANRKAWRPLRLLGLLTIHLALLISGLIVSTKIGGGNNLHNLDAFIVLMAVTIAYLIFNRFVVDDPGFLVQKRVPVFLILLLALIPVLFAQNSLSPFSRYDHASAWNDINQLQGWIDRKVKNGDEVLFIQDRHLLTFGLIENVKLVPEYEKVFLMEMAMAENEAYFEKFNHDLQNNRFSLIVVEPLHLGMKPTTTVFAEENNAWVKYVARPINQYYTVVFESNNKQLSVLAPRPNE